MHITEGDKPHCGQPRLLDPATCTFGSTKKSLQGYRFRMIEELQASLMHWLWQKSRDFSVHQLCVKEMTASSPTENNFNSLYNSVQNIP
jgi:hypothetical protein